MCNVAADTMAKLEQTVRQFLDEGRMFTGYDVTLETRSREGIKLRHQECRGAVHEMQFLTDAIEFGYDQNGQTVPWAKTQVNIGQGQWAFVFHPANVDPNGYQARTQSPAAAVTPNLTPVAASVTGSPATAVADDGSTTDSGGQNSDGTYSTDYRNRLFIQTRFVRELGLKAGDEVHIVADSANKTLALVADSSSLQGMGYNIGTQRVERNGDLRLSSATLRCADLTTAKFKIETGDRSGVRSVEITAA